MRLLPVAHALGILGVTEVILVLRLGQPDPHELPLPGLAALGFEAIALVLAAPIIGKKKSLAVQALLLGSGRLHRFHTRKSNQYPKSPSQGAKKIQPQQQSAGRRKKILQ
jgi:hypothetical protein